MTRKLFGFALALLMTSSMTALAETASTAQPVAKATAASIAKQLDISQEDRDAIRFVVQTHVASLSQQRPDLFSKTFTKKTQEAFESSSHMLAFFSLRYLPVRFGKSFHFDNLSLSGKVPIQSGYLIDKTGMRWRLSYGLQHMGNGDWRIISTIIEPAPGDPT